MSSQRAIVTTMVTLALFGLFLCLTLSRTSAQFPGLPSILGSNGDNDGNNSVLPTLPSLGNPFATGDSSSTTTTNNNNNNSNNNNNNNPLNFLNNLVSGNSNFGSTTNTGTTTTNTGNSNKPEPLPSILGPWVPDGKCQSSTNCCCATGPVIITSDGTGSVKASGLLSETGCQGFKNITEVFKKWPFIPINQVNDTVATWSIPVYGFTYRGQQLWDGDTITIKRTDTSAPSGCLNTLYRGAYSNGNGSTTGSGSTNTPTTPVETPPVKTEPTQDLYSPGSFSATGTPSTVTSVPASLQMDSSHSISVDIVPETTGSSKYMVRMTIVPASSLFSSSAVAKWVTIHYISPTAADDRAAQASPMNIAMKKSDVQGLIWTFNSVGLVKDSPSGNGMRLSFSYYQPSAGIVRESATLFYNPNRPAGTSTGGVSTTTTPKPTTPTTTTPAPTTPTSSNTTPKTTGGKWAGTYTIDTSQCTSSSSCCCALGKITVVEIPGSTTQVAIASTLDGSQTCGGMSDVTGDFNFDDGFNASYEYPDSPLVLKASLSNDYATLSFSNTIYTCKSVGRRTQPAWVTAGATAPKPAPVGNGGTASQGQLLAVIGGQWKATGKCTPTANCCCLEDGLEVMSPNDATKLGKALPSGTNPNDPTTVFVTGQLDGGIACFRHKEIDGICSINAGSGTGTCKLQGINFNATISDNNTHLTIENSMYLNCISTAVKVDSSGVTVGIEYMGILIWILILIGTLCWFE